MTPTSTGRWCSVAEFIRDTAALGYALGIILVLLAVTIIVVAIVKRRDDGFQPIGQALPPPPRRSPFAPGVVETGRVDRIGLDR